MPRKCTATFDGLPCPCFQKLSSRRCYHEENCDYHLLICTIFPNIFFAFFKLFPRKCCTKLHLQAFDIIQELSGHEFPGINRINRRFLNTFFKTYKEKICDDIRWDVFRFTGTVPFHFICEYLIILCVTRLISLSRC